MPSYSVSKQWFKAVYDAGFGLWSFSIGIVLTGINKVVLNQIYCNNMDVKMVIYDSKFNKSTF